MELAHWSTEHWNQIQQPAQNARKVSVALKILPLCPLPDAWARTIPSNALDRVNLSVAESDLPVLEVSAEFSLTASQVYEEALSAAASAAANAARIVYQSIDSIAFQGRVDPTLGNRVQVRGTPPTGLIDAAPEEEAVDPTRGASDTAEPAYGNNTFNAVVRAISHLQVRAHVGPYALVLPQAVYADAFELDNQFVPAERIAPLVTAGFYPGLVPETKGFVVSLGGQVVELCVGVDTKAELLQQASGGAYVFRVFQRSVLRLIDASGVQRLIFRRQPGEPEPGETPRVTTHTSSPRRPTSGQRPRRPPTGGRPPAQSTSQGPPSDQPPSA
jgi:encapsulating protein for peroxidase